MSWGSCRGTRVVGLVSCRRDDTRDPDRDRRPARARRRAPRCDHVQPAGATQRAVRPDVRRLRSGAAGAGRRLRRPGARGDRCGRGVLRRRRREGHERVAQDRGAATRSRWRPGRTGDDVATTLPRQVSMALHEFPTPVVAVLPRAVAGAGLSIALSADLRIAAERAVLVTAFADVGASGRRGTSAGRGSSHSWSATRRRKSGISRRRALHRARCACPRHRQPGASRRWVRGGHARLVPHARQQRDVGGCG